MSTANIEVGKGINLTATNDVTTKNTSILGFYVNSTTAGTLVLRKGGSGGTVMGGLITPAVGWHEYPFSIPGGLHATIGGTLNVTFSIQDES